MAGISMNELPAGGLIRYGTVTFPTNTRTTALSVMPVWDQAGRTVIYSRIRISLECVLAGSAIDADVRAVVQQLNRPAFPFVYAGRGWGLSVNVGSVRDVLWGPKPSEVTIKPEGGGNAVTLTWTVEVHIPDAANAAYRFKAMEFNWTVAYDIDEAGYTTRTYGGFIRIPMTRSGGPGDRRINDSIDSYREDVYPGLIEGFRRGPKTWSIDAAKTRADFSVTDTQMPPNVPPRGIVEADADYSLHTIPGFLDKRWVGRITGTYEIARNGVATAGDALRAFLRLAADRVNYTRSTLEQLNPELSARGTSPPFIMPTGFEISEPAIYGRSRVRMSMTYIISGTRIEDMLKASGLTRPAPGSDWKFWAASMGPVLGPRGHAGLVFRTNDDAIVDLFGPEAPPVNLNYSNPGVPGAPGPGDLRGLFPSPDPANSWIHYECRVYVQVDNGVVEVRTLPEEPRTAAGDLFGGATPRAPAGPSTSVATEPFFPPPSVATEPFFTPRPQTPDQQRRGGGTQRQAPQRRGRQTGAVFLVGRAARWRYSIECPTLVRWGGVNLTPANRPERGEGFRSAVVGNALWPVTAATWCLRYLPDGPLPSATAPLVPTPMYGGGGAAAANLAQNIGNLLAGVKFPIIPFGS